MEIIYPLLDFERRNSFGGFFLLHSFFLFFSSLHAFASSQFIDAKCVQNFNRSISFQSDCDDIKMETGRKKLCDEDEMEKKCGETAAV